MITVILLNDSMLTTLVKTKTQKRRDILKRNVANLFSMYRSEGLTVNAAMHNIEEQLPVSASCVYKWLVDDGVIVPKPRKPRTLKNVDEKEEEEGK